VYIFPNEGNLEEFFDTLTSHSNHPSHEPHIYAGDFNAYTAEEIESHITTLDSHTLFRRMGDTNPAHSPASPLTTATAPAADYIGRLLLNMLSSIKFIITNCRFPSPSLNHRAYNFLQKLNTYPILDYNLSQTPRTPHSHVSSSSKCPSYISYRSYAQTHPTEPAHLIQFGFPTPTSHLSCPHYLPLQALERSTN